jgi:hypothetical protein
LGILIIRPRPVLIQVKQAAFFLAVATTSDETWQEVPNGRVNRLFRKANRLAERHNLIAPKPKGLPERRSIDAAENNRG